MTYLNDSYWTGKRLVIPRLINDSTVLGVISGKFLKSPGSATTGATRAFKSGRTNLATGVFFSSTEEYEDERERELEPDLDLDFLCLSVLCLLSSLFLPSKHYLWNIRNYTFLWGASLRWAWASPVRWSLLYWGLVLRTAPWWTSLHMYIVLKYYI